MCIAIIKPSSVLPPSMEIFERCFKKNSDGAGIAISDGKEFTIHKGLMTFDAFKAKYDETVGSMSADDIAKRPMAFHFRIGTHGSRDDPKHTHPFPVSSKVEELEAISCKSRHIAMHNGILSSWGTSAYATGPKISDTMDFIKDFVAPIQRLLGKSTFFDSKDAQDLVTGEVPGQRFTVMEPDGRFVYWGAWVKDEGSGLFYSNTDYKESVYVPPSTAYKGTGYDWNDDDYWKMYDRGERWNDSFKRTEESKPTTTSWRTYPLPVDDVAFTVTDDIDIDFPLDKKDVDAVARLYGLYPVYGKPTFTLSDGSTRTPDFSPVYMSVYHHRAYLWDGIDGFEFYTRYAKYTTVKNNVTAT